MNRKSSFEKMPQIAKDFGKVLILSLDEAAAIAIVLLVLYFLHIKLTPVILIGASVIFIVLVLLRHMAAIPSFHLKQATGREGMIGEEGKVIQALTPIGLVSVRGEYWSARTVNGRIEIDEEVEIVGFEGLILVVKPKGGQPLDSLP
jgi:membrane protein implicated in regulation of membrane protease activity